LLEPLFPENTFLKYKQIAVDTSSVNIKLKRYRKMLQLLSIGLCHTSVSDDEVASQRKSMVSTLEVFDEFKAALSGIDKYSHLMILFWMHQVTLPTKLRSYPRGDHSLPLTGAFASRGRNHPNPIGLAVVELLERLPTGLVVRGLDAFDKTPILDIKPYDDYDSISNPRVPDWFARRARKAGV
jgi:tRNA-Thr(GGU) m(6)t(6)A37 methyltransferase TsaA